MKKFTTSFTGYSKNEVNGFINEVTKEYESMLNNLKQKDVEIERLKNELVRYQNLESTLNRALLVAEESSNNIKKMARDEGVGIVQDAKRNASRIVNDALLRAEQVQLEAENLKRRVIIFKRRFKQALEEQITQVNEIDERL
ncbi:MAG: DivIVA domain-containing protein [Bacilli bacterium]|nr:DivIVA domain-containing protein [Bacilli bacterium]